MRFGKAVLAFLLFLSLNALGFAAFQHYKADVGEDLAASAMRSAGSSPDVVFSGSSTVLYPLWALEATVPHRGQYNIFELPFIEKQLKDTLNKAITVCNVAYMGFMISDDYFIADQWLIGRQCPKVIVTMVTPRDFYDVGFATPSSGIAFRKLSNVSNLASFCGNYLTCADDYIDFLIGHTVFGFTIRGKVQDKVYSEVASEVSGIQAKLSNVKAAPESSKLERSLKEYEHRYHGISTEAMQRQFRFFEKFTAMCRNRDIKLIVVNAPLTPENLALLPPGLYERYCAQLAAMAQSNTFQFIDYSHSTKFTKEDFSDSVHLNAQGALKFARGVLPGVVAGIEGSHRQPICTGRQSTI